MTHSALRPFTRRPALLRGVSLSALLVAGGAIAPARAGSGFKSLGQALASHPSSAAVAAAISGGGATAAKQAGLGAQNFANAAAKFRSLSQALAAQTTYTGTPVADGVTPGGLQQAPGVAGSNSSTLWSGASTTLTQTVAGGITDVTVQQTGSIAALTWKNFNIGAHTKLVFNQSAGGTLASSWVAINSVQDPTASPTTILGQISAPGKVYILNPNGILFGAGSQVNVGGLVATTASIAQTQFTTDTNGIITAFSLYGSAGGTTSVIAPTFVLAPADTSVQVAAGAVITTPVPTGTSGGGYVMLLGGSVQNEGAITTPQGQTVLAAGSNFVLQAGYSANNPTATVVGSQVAVTNPAGSISATSALGSVANSGLVVADQGDITMVGHLVTQAGVLLATTTVDNRGTVHLLTDSSDSTAQVVLAPGSVTEIMPEDLYSLNGTLVTPLENPQASQGTLQTALNAQRATNLAASITDNNTRNTAPGVKLNDFNNLTDTLGEGRIEISTGGTVNLQGGALALAQGGQVAVNAGQAITVDSGATIDVSGTNASLPATANSLFVQGIVPYYLRDSAANRTGGLEFTNVYIDERTLVDITGGAYAGNIYTQGGLLEVSGNLNLIGHGINEWTSIAGQVTLQSASTQTTVSSGKTTTVLVGGTITVEPGATINLTGGTVTYAAGMVPQSYVQSTDGRIFNINDAPGNLVYTGVYTGVTESQPRWHITQTFVNPLLTPSETYASAYTIGRDAGSLTVSAATALLDGTVAAGVTVGQNQTAARPAVVTDPFLLVQSVTPLAGALTVGAYSGGQLLTPQYASVVLLGAGPGGLPAPVAGAPIEAVSGTISLDTTALNNAGLASVSVLTAGSLTVGGALTLADGGTLALGGSAVTVDAAIVVHSGQVALTTVNGQLPLSDDVNGIALDAAASIDTSGRWTNLLTAPDNHALAGYANGGGVSIISSGGLDLAAGSVIDVSSGGVLSVAGKLAAAAGGNVTISADIVPTLAATYVPAGDVTVASTFRGFASGAAGTLAITVPDIVLGASAPNLFEYNPNAQLALPDNALFASGFASYQLNGFEGVEVDAGRSVAVTRPVYVLSNPAVATGAAASAAYSVTLPPLFTPSIGTDTITQRAGASVALASSIDATFVLGEGGPVFIDPGASITVDPKQSILVAGYGQVTDYGTLTARGGTITLANTRGENYYASDTPTQPNNYQPGLSVWIGDAAVVDASGEAVTFTDASGRIFGQAQAGGTILLGGLGGLSASSTLSTYAQVIERPGALLNADGAAAAVDVVPAITANGTAPFAAPVTLAGNGGTIVARSYDGIAFDGALQAAGEGRGAAGGALELRLDVENLLALIGLPAYYTASSRILISQDQVPVQTADLVPGETTSFSTSLLGRISQAQLDAGGFDTIDLFAQDYIAFDGAVALHAGRSITLESGTIGETSNTASASVAAPYVSLVGFNPNDYDGIVVSGYGTQSTLLPPGLAHGTLTVDAAMIDIVNEINIGGQKASLNRNAPPYAFGFASTDLVSTGDIRFDAADGVRTVVDSSGNITLQAAQLYPASGANAEIFAGDNVYADGKVPEFAGGTLTVLGQGDTPPPGPYSIGGSLALVSETVIQDGVVRAPEGELLLGANVSLASSGNNSDQQVTNVIDFGPNSVTSVSLYGQTVPFGGTVDGVNYTYAGGTPPTLQPAVILNSAEIAAAPGAQIDLRGGGTLAGAGFIPGRGGTADVNLTPLLNSLGGTVTANTTDRVFAIVPGYGSAYAPVSPGDTGYTTPGIGAQVTIGAGEVPGLAAGSYTLLPAYYDLLPGGYRVELTSSAAAPGTTQPFGNFTTLAAVTVGTANTPVATSVPQAALITSGAGVRQLSQYDEETYNQFEATAATTFGAPRPVLPQDAKTLEILLNSPVGSLALAAAMMPASVVPISIDTASLLRAPATFAQGGGTAIGYGATVEVSNTGTDALLVQGAGDPAVTVPGVIFVPDIALDALTAPVAVTLPGVAAPVAIGTRLALGGTLTTNDGTITLTGTTQDLVLLPRATVTAADVLLASNDGSIAVGADATISAVGQGVTSYGTATGFLFTGFEGQTGNAVLAVSNNNLQFVPAQFPAAGEIRVDPGATLRTEIGGSLNFQAPSGTDVEIAPATLAASYVTLAVANINVGSAASLATFAPALPGGLTITDAALNTLAQGATVLSLTAQQEVNFLGDVTLDSGRTDLVLNTPAIYGYGIAGPDAAAGNVVIAAPNFTWSGVAATGTVQGQANGITVSATPGGALGGSAGAAGLGATLTGAGSLTVQAGTIDLGYGPGVPVNDQVQLDRLAVGFGDVVLQARTDITANNKSSLSVYQTQTVAGQAGTGGNLTLDTPLVTAASGAVLKLNAGGTFDATTPAGAAPAATGTVSTLGAEIDVTAAAIDTSTAFALPAGRLSLTADGTLSNLSTITLPPSSSQTMASQGTVTITSSDTTLTVGTITGATIDLLAGTDIDLAGRSTNLFDQKAYSTGGTLLLESASGTVTQSNTVTLATTSYAGGSPPSSTVTSTSQTVTTQPDASLADGNDITIDPGALARVSAPGARAGAIAISALDGTVTLAGTLDGSSPVQGGSFTLLAGTLGSPTSFDGLNQALDTGGFTALRDFEFTTGDVTVDGTVAARTVDIAADTGNITVTGTIDAAGSTPGNISLSAGDVLTIGGTALLDAHATSIAHDSYYLPIDAENRAHVTLTSSGASASASVVLASGARIDVSYPTSQTVTDAQGVAHTVTADGAQGQLVINAPRTAGTSITSTLTDVAVSATGRLDITGAQSIDLFAFRTYTPTDADGTIVQNNGTGTLASASVLNRGGTLGLVQIGLQNAAYMAQVDSDGAALAAGQLAGLAAYGAKFNFAPGVEIASAPPVAGSQTPAAGNLTISGDLDFSGLRYADPAQFGSVVNSAIAGSGEAGSIVFRAANDLIVNGSVTDGFLPPPDKALNGNDRLAADLTGWTLHVGSPIGYTDPTNADLLLPSSAYGVYYAKGTAHTSDLIVLLSGSTFDTTRPISLNYAITVSGATLNSNVVIPFQLTIGSASPPIPAGGWVASSTVTGPNGAVLFQKGALIPAGYVLQAGDVLAAGAVLPINVTTSAAQFIPAATPFSVFNDGSITLADDTAPLPANALIPSNSAVFFGVQYIDDAGDTKVKAIKDLYLRAPLPRGVQGYLYPLAQLLPAGASSWNMGFVAGANPQGADANAVQARSSLDGGAAALPTDTVDQAPGSLLIDDQHYLTDDFTKATFSTLVATAFSVIRTGTGNLTLVAGGNIDVSSLYGIYTAGAQSPSLGAALDGEFDTPREVLGKNDQLLTNPALSALISSSYQAYYPVGGGDVLVAAQGNMTSDVTGDISSADSNLTGIPPSDLVGDWLWRQGSATLGQPTAWWINFGTLVDPLLTMGTTALNTPQIAMTGFQGIAALGGGNVTVTIGGDAGQMTDRDEATNFQYFQRGEGLVIAVGSTGRLLPGTTTPLITGGGDLTLTVGGTLNPLDAAAYGVGAATNAQTSEAPSINGDLINIRGDIDATAGAIGRIDYVYNSGSANFFDPRSVDPATPNDGVPNGGIEVVPGDSSVTIDTMRDLVLAGAGDPGREALQSLPEEGPAGVGTFAALGANTLGVLSGFSLWQSGTSISLLSAGGNVTPTTIPNQVNNGSGLSFANDLPTDYREEYPPNLLVTAATGDIIYGQDGVTPSNAGTNTNYVLYSLETAPSPTGQLQFLAGKSIFANGYAVDISGANPAALSSIADPAFQVVSSEGPSGTLTNVLPGPELGLSALALFALEADTPTTNLHAADNAPARFYAADGDIVNFQTGATLDFVSGLNLVATWYLAAKPVWILASGDIVSTGTRPSSYPSDGALFSLQENQGAADNGIAPAGSLGINVYSSGDLFLNNNPTDVSVISAGRDILSAYAYIGGPGLLEVDAGRNIFQGGYSVENAGSTQQVLSFGAFKSLGDNLIAGGAPDFTGGAGIAVLAGIGANGPNYTAFADLYFNPANQANLAVPLTDPSNAGKVQQVYTAQLVDWLAANYPSYAGGADNALAWFLANVPAVDQDVFIRGIFFAELAASGTQEADPNSKFYHSYVRGQDAIDTLFDRGGALGVPTGYNGTITAYSGPLLNSGGQTITTNGGSITLDSSGVCTNCVTFDGGIATLNGGTITALNPGGSLEFGIPGGPAPGNNSGIITYGPGDIDVYALGSVELGKSRIFATGGGNITIWSSTGDINAGIGAKTSISYTPPTLVYDATGDITETPPDSTSGAGIATLQPLPSVPAGNVSLIAPVGTVDAGEAGVRVSGNLVLAAARVANAANLTVKGSTAGAPTVAVASLGAVEAAGAAAGAATNSAQSQSQRNNQERDVSTVLDVEVLSVGGTYEDDQKKRKRAGL